MFNRDRRPVVRLGLSVAVAGGLVLLIGLLPRGGEAARLSPWVIAPPVVALVLALGSRRPAASMFTAMLLGALIAKPDWTGVTFGIWKYWLSNLFDLWHVCAMAFALCLLGLVQIMTASGGTGAILSGAARYVRGRRGSKLGTALAGLLVFFDDYANALMVGPTLRPLTDRYGVSREKLAYLVDSTAAPVAGLALMSTWVGYEVGLLQEVSVSLGLDRGGYALLLEALPYRFYCVFSLLLVFASSAWERDFEPMLTAERACAVQDDTAGEASTVGESSSAGRRGLWLNAALPLLVLMLSVPVGLMLDGGLLERLSQPGVGVASLSAYADALMGSENNTVVLLSSGLLATLVGTALPLLRGDARAVELGRAFGGGARAALPPLAILMSAWALSGACKDIGTGAYLLWALEDALAGALVPLASFAIAALVAFFTGTSWGTMAIVIPAVSPLAHATGSETLLFLTLASVLDGAIFGDHCSPISDTTVMSCVATNCDLAAHVKTQLPYAMTAMGVAATCGYLWVAGGGAASLSYALGTAALTGILWVFGRSVSPR